MRFYLGLDLGQKRDHSAVVAVERVDRVVAYRGTVFEKLVVRYAERMALGLPYPKIVARVKEIVQCDELRGDCVLAVDGTGVGAPVVDMLRAARLGCDLTAVTITGGERESGGCVPKRDLMAGLQVLLENGELRIGRLKERDRLVKELVDVKMSFFRTGRMRMGADGVGEHDDLVIALALACWRARKRGVQSEGTRRLPGI